MKAVEKLKTYFGREPSQNRDGSYTFCLDRKLNRQDEIEIGNICHEYKADFSLGTHHVTVFETKKCTCKELRDIMMCDWQRFNRMTVEQTESFIKRNFNCTYYAVKTLAGEFAGRQK